MMMKEINKKRGKKTLEKNLFRLFRPWHIANDSCHAGFCFQSSFFYNNVVVVVAAFGLFHFGPFVSIYFQQQNDHDAMMLIVI